MKLFGDTGGGPLHGIPLALKDLIDTAGIRTTAASALFKDRIPAEDAEVVRRLKNAGAVLLGKTTCTSLLWRQLDDQLLRRSSQSMESGAHRWRSSGGSVAAVAAGLCYWRVGNRYCGFGRSPPALCGIVG